MFHLPSSAFSLTRRNFLERIAQNCEKSFGWYSQYLFDLFGMRYAKTIIKASCLLSLPFSKSLFKFFFPFFKLLHSSQPFTWLIRLPGLILSHLHRIRVTQNPTCLFNNTSSQSVARLLQVNPYRLPFHPTWFAFFEVSSISQTLLNHSITVPNSFVIGSVWLE